MLQTERQILFLDLTLDLIEDGLLLCPAGKEIVLHQLLCNGAGTLRCAEGGDVFRQRTDDAPHVDTVMMVKPFVLDGDDCSLQIIRDLLQRNVNAVGLPALELLDLPALLIQYRSEILVGRHVLQIQTGSPYDADQGEQKHQHHEDHHRAEDAE